MTELKTLKDIISPTNDWQEASEKHIYEDLKQEAIKWVKEEVLPGTTQSEREKIKAWIKYFFNITEEDINQVKGGSE